MCEFGHVDMEGISKAIEMSKEQGFLHLEILWVRLPLGMPGGRALEDNLGTSGKTR